MLCPNRKQKVKIKLKEGGIEAICDERQSEKWNPASEHKSIGLALDQRSCMYFFSILI